MTWYTLFNRPTQTGAQDANGSTVREVIPVAAYNVGAPATGTQIRITLRASTANALNLPKTYIGHAATSGDAADFDGTQVQVLYNSGTAAASVPTNTTLVSDAVTYAFSKTKPTVISAFVTFPGNFALEPDPDISYYLGSGDVASVTNFTPTGQTTSVIIPKAEIWFDDPPGNPTCTIDKSPGQADPTSATSISFKVQFNKGVTGFTAADVNLSSSTAGGTLVAAVSGSDLAYTITVTGMLTAGNITVTIPAGVCIDAASNPNVAAVPIDNVVAWDPDIIAANAPNVFEVTTVARDMLRIEVRDPPVTAGYYEVLSTPDTGTGTFAITNVANNGHGLIRVTTTYGTDLVNYYIQTMANNGSGLIRCTMFDTSLLGGTVPIRADFGTGTVEANGTWPITVINSTTFDLVGSTFTNTYLGGAFIYNADQLVNTSMRVVIHSVGGTTEANGSWQAIRSGATTLDLMDSHFVNAYTSGGRIIQTYAFWQRPNPSKGGALDYCMLTSRLGLARRFQDVGPNVGEFLERDAALVAANYSITGGLSVTSVYHKTKPYSGGGYGSYTISAPSYAYASPAVAFRHYLYLQLSGNLVSGNTYTLTFPSGAALPPKTFTFNDKTTRCCAIHVDQNGHRPGDPGKRAYLSEWVPEHGTRGEMDYSSVTAWYLIDSGGSIAATFGAPALRGTPTTIEGASIANPDGISEPRAQTPFLVREGPAMKIVSVTKANPCTVTVDDASRVSNDMMVAFSDMEHWTAPGGGSKAGMRELENDVDGRIIFFRAFNKSGNTFQLRCPITVLSATIASGGTGYAVGDRVWLNNRVTLVVSAVSSGVITAITVPTAPYIDYNRNNNPGSGAVYPPTAPSNPQAQVSVFDANGTARPGTGATFNLTWGRHPFISIPLIDTASGYNFTAIPGGFGWGNPNSTSHTNFAQSISDNRGNLVYTVNELGNRAGTNVYGLDYPSFTSVGTYKIYLPNIGVSDPIRISEGRHWAAALNLLKAVYHQRSGTAIDGRFGFTRPITWKHRPEQPVYKSYLPYAFSNYAIEQATTTIPDINFGELIGGGHTPWITNTPYLGFGGHVDAGDWDVRIDETGWYYYEILDTWERLPTAAKASFYNMGTPTLLASGADPVVFAGTDGLPSPIVEVIWGLEVCRSGQEVSGAIWGGLNYGEGVAGFDTSWDAPINIYAWYPDQSAAYEYAFIAAKLSVTLTNLGYTSLASTYQTSAVSAYNWAVSIDTNTTTRDAHYLPVKQRAKWSTPTYDANMAGLTSRCADQQRVCAAAALFRLTGSSTYKTYCDAHPLGSVDVKRTMGRWEYATSPGADATIKTDTFAQIAQYALNVIVANAEATDIPYTIGQEKSIWAMNFGPANNWQIWSPALSHAIAVFSTAGDPNFSPTNAARCRKVAQWIAAHRYGANQIGLCMSNGAGVRHCLESLHSDSKNSGQALPVGISSEGWCGSFPGLPNIFGDSNISKVAHPQYDPGMVITDPTIKYREIFPYDQLAWPRFEMLIENSGAIEHMEYTTQQQLLPALSITMHLAGFDGNAATDADVPTVAAYQVQRPMIRLR